MSTTTENTKHKNIHPHQSVQAWFSLLFRPDHFFTRVKSGDTTSWIFPIFLLTLVLILQSIAQGVALGHLQHAQPTGFSLPGLIIFNIATLWIVWLWAGSVLRSFTILSGIRCPEWQPRVIISWILSPLVFRHLIRLIYTLMTGTPVTTAGLSGFIAQPTGFIGIFISQILSQTDIYLVWQIILLWIGLKYLPTIQPTQRLMSLLFTVFNMLILYALLNTLAVFLRIL